MDKNQRRREMMIQTPVPELIIKLAIPTIISMLVTAIYNTADTFFVGKISTEATAAVGLVFTVMALIQALGFFFGHGSGNYLSRMLGAGNNEEASNMAATGFALAILMGIVMAVAGNFFIDDLARLIGSTETTLEDTRNYMRIILIGAPFMTGQFVINNQLRFQGSAVYAMAGLMSGALMNLILDPLLILGFKMGVSGAAIATIMGQITSFAVLYIGSKKGGNIRIHLSNVHINFHFIKEIINGGAPSLFRQGLAALSTLLLNKAAGSLGGDAAIAGMSVTTRVMMMMASALIGFGQGYQPVCSFNYGAGLKKRVKEGYFFCVKYSTIFLTVIGVLCFINAPFIISVFRKDPDVIAVGAVALRWQAATLPLSGCIVISNMMLQSIGKGMKATITSSARNGIFFIPLILILPRVFGIFGVEITQAVADILSLVITVPLAYSELRKFD
ncbi:MATE family efflux transporter [Butyrivibrio sp. NC2002]|uniref:MATE family efflux transporter n=1 Tax=Butyrivibrio sp. NC2002 TaxID=1410610 RepID=UPI000A62C2F6|nr:MATE family efflux transporter [Butyrivibrio sp. NC2002]